MPPSKFPDAVAEMQGLYGPFTMAERVVQKLWLQQDFAAAHARLEDGRPLTVLAPGTWNLLAGPDFRGARLRLGDRVVIGDVEVHFHARDWVAHGHRRNPDYDRVVLHVVLFPPAPADPVMRDAAGAPLPLLVLLPLLWRDLEDYAADDALEALTARDEWRRFAELAGAPAAEVRQRLRAIARARWERKVHFARVRIERLGWAGAAHATALEILGYHRNRAAMLAVAERWPLAGWRSDPAAVAAAAETGGDWQNHGVRPANRAGARLRQYAAWVRARPDWPERLIDWAGRLPELAEVDQQSTSGVRRTWAFAGEARALAEQVTGGTIGGSRWPTMVCDGLLPLAAARTGRELAGWWFHWPSGDQPDRVRRALARLGVAGLPGCPHCHGLAQGLLGWLLEREQAA